jgi:zinc protease
VAQLLEVRLRKALREELSGTYGVSVSAEPARLPRPGYHLRIAYGSAPERAAELAAALLSAVRVLRDQGPTAGEVASWKETVLRHQELALRENDAWASLLASTDAGGEDLAAQLDLHRWLDPLTPERLRSREVPRPDPVRSSDSAAGRNHAAEGVGVNARWIV